jgi:hypothetical protein
MPAAFHPVLLSRHLDKFVRSFKFYFVLLLSAFAVYIRYFLGHVSLDFHPSDPAVVPDVKEDRLFVDSKINREPINPPPFILKTTLKMLYLVGG